MAHGDLKTVGPAGTIPRYLVAGGTSILAGEPVDKTTTITSGAVSANTWLLVNADTPVIGTDLFGGVSLENSLNNTAATPVVLEQFLNCSCPVPELGRLRGTATTQGNVDTASELALLVGDVTLINGDDTTGASDGGELFTIIETATADTSGFTIVGGNPAVSELDVVVHPHAYRFEIS